MSVLIYHTDGELIEALAAYIFKIGNQAIEERGRFNFVLTGGNSPKPLYHALATTFKDSIDWSKVYFFFGDERDVEPGLENYNGLMARESILDPLEIPNDQVFYVNTTLAPAQAADAYIERITAHFKGSEINFDLILLGMGNDAHTASLFPETEILKSLEATVDSVYVEKLAAFRISFTAPLINKARNVAFLVTGDSKAEALRHVIDGTDKNIFLYPAQLISPSEGTLTWFLDAKSSKLLNG
jgi:6-phosphogluconolactonase